MASWELRNKRTGKNSRHNLLAMFRQSVFGRLAGYEDVNDAGRLARDPVMRLITGQRDFDRPAASESQMGRFETGTLTFNKNPSALSDLSGKWVDRVQRLRGSPNLILDIDSSESPVHGEQEASAYNGHFGCSCYHPLFVFNQHGDLEGCSLRPGNVHSADNWKAVLDPVILMDRAGWHTTAKLNGPKNITIILLPSPAPELNPVENIWQYLRQNWLSNRVFEDYDAILDAASQAWNRLIRQPDTIRSIGRRVWINKGQT